MRVVIPEMYGYKNVKWVEAVNLVAAAHEAATGRTSATTATPGSAARTATQRDPRSRDSKLRLLAAVVGAQRRLRAERQGELLGHPGAAEAEHHLLAGSGEPQRLAVKESALASALPWNFVITSPAFRPAESQGEVRRS